MRHWLILTIYFEATSLYCGNFKHIPMSGRQQWIIWVNQSYESASKWLNKDCKTKFNKSCISWDWKWTNAQFTNELLSNIIQSKLSLLLSLLYYQFYHHHQQQQQHHLTQHRHIFIWLSPYNHSMQDTHHISPSKERRCGIYFGESYPCYNFTTLCTE